jgi:hypothetical protein
MKLRYKICLILCSSDNNFPLLLDYITTVAKCHYIFTRLHFIAAHKNNSNRFLLKRYLASVILKSVQTKKKMYVLVQARIRTRPKHRKNNAMHVEGYIVVHPSNRFCHGNARNIAIYLRCRSYYAVDNKRNKTGCCKAADMIAVFYSTYLISAAAASIHFLSYLQDIHACRFSLNILTLCALRIKKKEAI